MSSSGRSSNHYPSFSSTLLEEIYRSLDEERENQNRHRMMIMKSTMKKSSSCYMDRDRDDFHRSRVNHRFVAVDQWIENEKINLRRKSTPPVVVHSDAGFHDRRQINHSSSTSSSDSSWGIGGFSSSDTESMYGSAKSKQKPPAALKPIRTAAKIPAESSRKSYCNEIPAKKKTSKEGNLQRRALKLYSELKKVKQPISPGGKLTSFLNSLFHSGGASKKPNTSSPALSSTSGSKVERESPATTTTSRSCLSKTPSSAGRTHRTVRFVDEDDHWKCDVAKRDCSILANAEEFKLQIKEKQRRVEEVAKELLKNYHHHNRKDLKVNIVPDGRKFDLDHHNNILSNIRNSEDEEEDEDDDVSCGSSDLFELENLLEIGMVDRYGEELPVYETTHVHTNRAIANGFIL